jgi:hypothetical protein
LPVKFRIGQRCQQEAAVCLMISREGIRLFAVPGTNR